MATLYVSNAATNGYAIGNDSNTAAQMQSKSTPALTLSGAVTAATAGDTIILNPEVYKAATYVNISKANLTIQSDPDLDILARVQSTDTTRVLYQNATGLTLKDILIDGEENTTYCIQQANGKSATCVLDGVQMLDFTQRAFQANEAGSLTIQGGCLIQSSVVNATDSYGAGIFIVMTVVGSVLTIDDIEFDVTVNSGNYIVSMINATATAAGCKAIINQDHKITGTYGKSGTATSYLKGIWIRGFAEIEIDDWDLIPTTPQLRAIDIPNAAQAVYSCKIYNCKPQGISSSSIEDGIGICIGNDDMTEPANSYNINGIDIRGCEVKHKNHGILLAWVKNAHVNGCKVEHGVVGIVGKKTQNCFVDGNILKDISTGGALRAKAGNGDKYVNNTVIVTTLATTAACPIQATDASVGIEYDNNNIYTDVACLMVNVQDTSAATFNNNNYYAKAGLAANAFNYQGTYYQTIATWKAAKESTALNVDPEFLDYTNGDYRLAITSALRKAGKGVRGVRDYRGFRMKKPLPVGAYDSGPRDARLIS